ncbi:response regulator with CheY-like receiver domain and winged-helix DNA-binding domain [Streptomyces lincolnensis]|uniref:Response regulator with CheY-like receiver domain and winged-helix DNA-binding domain n=1 Tax=Streptomyces lincolnensis TaxID=1915 RepID=A0A1B1M1Z5_STRLN|nr:response regulator transcription factor [Streptomyces lincolnensis]ANS62681.1 response regulator with CheY-like receiver domain and winged-helix DNA-binding domain [Streptomyces lincolnensis]AXG51606.1 response regulator with CheY-like receiver domain and winged-helix DNA-binding domain [Streptomyces lincolnensis]QMV04627.1 response regulator [Streptomyces lincolnensis]QMV11698.1 response regulator [Streptomyces lincolnensis]
MCAHVLVAEDDEMQAELIRRSLLVEGHTITVVHDGAAALDAARRRRPDLVVLDLMLPVIDGFDVCRALRRDDDIPVLMLTARTAEDDVLRGLELGADDYMTKPYSPRELMARIRTVLRRSGRTDRPEDPVVRAGGIAVDPVRHEVRCEGRPVECTPAEFEILLAMAAEPERVFSRRQLLEITRGTDRASTERAVDVHIMNLRRKTEPDPRRPVRLLTVFGVGYKLSGGRG